MEIPLFIGVKTNNNMGKYSIADPEAPITLEDLESVIENNREKVWVNALIICLFYYGLRISECLSLEKRNFKLFKNKKTNREYVQLRSPTLKNKKTKHRVLYAPMDQPYVSLLYAYVRESPSARVWNYSRQWARVQIQKLMPQVSPHCFRHSLLNSLAQEGLNEFSLESWAGWSDARPASRYVQKVNNLKTADRYFKQ